MKQSIKASLTFLLALITPLISCSTKTGNIDKSYLNYKYVLRELGDLHGLPPTSNEVIDTNPGFTSYKQLFNLENSFINFQCKGTSYNDFYCEGSFILKNKNNETLVDVPSFVCEYTGSQSGMVIFEDNETKQKLGPIYVYTPYWCRWQFEYDIDGTGNTILLTFEFWKNVYNELPEFIRNS